MTLPLNLKALTHETLLPFRHGFFTRQEGASRPPYKSLNCAIASKDDPRAVAKNIARISAYFAIPVSHLIRPTQSHSSRVLTIDAPPKDAPAWRPNADGLVTRIPNIALSVLSADCQPVLLGDKVAGVIGIAHAGWRGAFGTILEEVVEKMEVLGAARNNISAVIGPAIGQESYEVDREFQSRFLDQSSENIAFFAKSPANPHRLTFDLVGYSEMKLQKAGVKNVERISVCTYQNPKDFFSYRYLCHHNLPNDGRQISAIMIAPRPPEAQKECGGRPFPDE